MPDPGPKNPSEYQFRAPLLLQRCSAEGQENSERWDRIEKIGRLDGAEYRRAECEEDNAGNRVRK